MSKLTNTENIPISVAVWLATDTYDHNRDPYTISATALLKPIKQAILSKRVPPEDDVEDISGLVKSSIGTAIHDSIEHAWTTPELLQKALTKLGYAKKLIDRVVVNPDPKDVKEGQIPVYLEKRTAKRVGKWLVTGKFDFIIEGKLRDFKSTSAYTKIFGNKDHDYIKQGSLYRWLNPDIVTDPQMAIDFIFTDFSAAKAIQDPKYPRNQVESQDFELEPIPVVQRFVERRLDEIERLMDAPEEDLPECTLDELWADPTVWKYYKKKDAKRATKNFDNPGEANKRLAADGHTGKVVEVPGKVKACKYCPAFMVCKQKDRYLLDGRLEI